MNPERWQRVKELLNEALELEPKRRSAFLNEHCAEDVSLREEVNSLLASYDEAGDEFMDRPPSGHSGLGAVPAAEDDPSLFAMRIGPYRIIEEIGRGGMGTVYKAIRAGDPANSLVALKIVKRGMDHDFVLRRFRHERQILAALEHPNIARLIDGGSTEDGLPYFVMEYIDGKPIHHYCDDHQLGTRGRLELFRQVCSAVQSAHRQRIIHRDIKPGNILIDVEGTPKLLDFGIAKILDPDLSTSTLDPTATVLRLMTPEYASPEQVRGDEITACSDVYSLGVLLYELLTGHRPYRLKSRSPHEIAHVICDETPEKPSTMVGRTEFVTRGQDSAVTVTPQTVSEARGTHPEDLRRTLAGDLDNIMMTAMRKEPHRRYPSAAALEEDIRRYLEGLPVSARGDSLIYRVKRSVSRNRAAAISAIVALVLGTVLMLAWRDWIEPRLKGRPQAPKTMPLTSFAGDETQPAFSPDGSRIAFVWGGENNDNSDIYMKPVRGVGLTRITTDGAEDVSPTWSADGSQIAFLRATETETAVFVSAASAGAVHGRITSLYPNRIEAVGRHLDWSPNGKYLAAADKKTPDEPFSIVLIEVTTGHKIQITDPPAGTVGDSNPAVSPDGLSVAFIRAVSSGVDDIFVVPITGGPVRRITTDKRYVISLAWAADGNSILFSSNRAGNHSLWRIPTAGGTPERVAAVGQNSSDPVFSRDGKLMAYSQFYMDSNIWRMDLVTGQTRKLIASTQYDSSPQYSPDGKRIAFRSSRSGGNEIWVAQADGTVDKQLTNFSSTLSGTPRWSPDGRFLAFDSRPEGQPDIFVVDVEEGSLRKATSDAGEDVVPSWSRDGNWIYFSSNRGGSWQVWKTPAKGGADQQVSKQGGFGPFESTDGFIYYAKGRSVAGLWRMRLDGSNEERILERLKPAYWGYWGLAPQGILFVDREASSYALHLYQPGRPAPVRLAAFDKPVIPGDAGLGVSPSGREVLYTQLDQSGSDIMLVDAPLAGK